MYDLRVFGNKGMNSPKVFSEMFNLQPDDCVSLRPEIGNGSLRLVNLENGLEVSIWNCHFNHRVQLDQFRAGVSDAFWCTLTYWLSPQMVNIRSNKQPGLRMDKLWNTAFHSGNDEFCLDVFPGDQVRCVSISFTRDWILSHAISCKKINAFISKVWSSGEPVFFLENYNVAEGKMITDICNHSFERHKDFLFMRSRARTLLNDFITKASERRSLPAMACLEIHEHRIREVEARLLQCLDGNLPNLKELAREFALSESTLKRNFKSRFGKSITSYYLDKKMRYAKELIGTDNKSVTETAYILGYEKVSHFIYMFKKHIGCLPGSFRRGLA